MITTRVSIYIPPSYQCMWMYGQVSHTFALAFQREGGTGRAPPAVAWVRVHCHPGIAGGGGDTIQGAGDPQTPKTGQAERGKKKGNGKAAGRYTATAAAAPPPPPPATTLGKETLACIYDTYTFKQRLQYSAAAFSLSFFLSLFLSFSLSLSLSLSLYARSPRSLCVCSSATTTTTAAAAAAAAATTPHHHYRLSSVSRQLRRQHTLLWPGWAPRSAGNIVCAAKKGRAFSWRGRV